MVVLITQELLCIEQITQPKRLRFWVPKLLYLIAPWIPTLQEDKESSLLDEKVLYTNLVQHLPFMWIAYNRYNKVVAAATLTQVVPERHAFVHGVRDIEYRKHSAFKALIRLIFEEAFLNLRLYKLKAEFEVDNIGALGFCRMHGFCKEAYFKEDNLIQGCRKDVVVYSLFSSTFTERQLKNNRRL